MKLTNKHYNILLTLNKENKDILAIALAIYSQSPKTIFSLSESLHIDLPMYVDVLERSQLLTKEDRVLANKSINLSSSFIKEDVSIDLPKKIIDNLNLVSGSRYGKSKQSTNTILAKISLGYSFEDFRLVNLYFTKLWTEDPSMKKYIRPSTLYNGKFEERVVVAREFTSSFQEKKIELGEIAKSIFKPIASINSPLLPSEITMQTAMDREEFVDFFSLKAVELLVFWLNKNYTSTQIKETIVSSIEVWAKQTRLLGLISIEKVLDDKFPQRVMAVSKLNSKKSALSDFANS